MTEDRSVDRWCPVHQRLEIRMIPPGRTFGDLEPCAPDEPVPWERRTVFCSRCGVTHAAEVTLGEGDFPEVVWLEAHLRTRADLVEDIGHAAGTALSIAIDAGDWELADKVAGQALDLNDPAGGAP